MTRIQVIIWKQEGQASQAKAGAGALAQEECERWSKAKTATWEQRTLFFGFWMHSQGHVWEWDWS